METSTIDRLELHKLLLNFCAKNDPRGFDLPIRIEGRLYYLDGKIVVSGPDQDVPTTSFKYADKIKEWCDKVTDNKEYKVLPELPAQELCEKCSGAGTQKEETCEDCDGYGEFTFGHCEYECKHCEGTGKTGGQWLTCTSCIGNGYNNKQYVVIDGWHFGLHYLHMIKRLLQNAKVAVGQPEDGYDCGTMFIRHDHGVGVLLGTRVF